MSNFPYWEEIFGECALFANPYDPKEIAETIMKLLSEEDLRRKIGKKGRELIQNEYSWEREQKKLLDFYNKVIEK